MSEFKVMLQRFESFQQLIEVVDDADEISKRCFSLVSSISVKSYAVRVLQLDLNSCEEIMLLVQRAAQGMELLRAHVKRYPEAKVAIFENNMVAANFLRLYLLASVYILENCPTEFHKLQCLHPGARSMAQLSEISAVTSHIQCLNYTISIIYNELMPVELSQKNKLLA